MDRLDGMMSVINGAPPPVSLGVIKRELELLRNEVILEMNFYCHCCGRKKKGKRDECEACLKPTSRLSDTVTMIICNVQWQLMNLLKYHGKEILYAHKRIHEGQETFHGTDVRRFSGYRCEMETRTEYQKGLINLIYTLSSDGARFKRLSKREATPVLLRVEGVDVETRTGGKCLTLVSMTYSEGGVQKNMLDAFVRSSLDILKDMDLRVEMDGTTITFRMTLMSYICDMKESYAISGLPNWYIIEGCSKCSITGVKIGNGKVSFNEMYTSPQRTDDSILYSAEKGIRGYTKPGVPVVFQFINPSKLTLDPFHLRGAGVCKFDEPEYRSEFGNSRLLKNYATEEAKKKKFVQVSSAKKSFKTNTFRAQFKNALKELRLGTFIIADGSSQGYFARRKRHIAKSKAHEAGEEEEES
ncbi:hypothetical protein L3Y34_014998 [Caenorhabditis briggsae]|nr:hypothetical protein L3Y34_014998 [Caenorhabditis briggsae]